LNISDQTALHSPLSSHRHRGQSTGAREEEHAMATIQRIAASTVAALTVIGVYTASAASASRRPLESDNPFSGSPTGHGGTTTIVNTGSPWWTFVLVAAAGAAFAVCVAALVGRMRQARHA
jgi:hypothetical protein